MNLSRLNASFTLVKYRDVIPAFRTALRELKLEHVIDASADQVLSTVQENFLVSHAPQMLAALTSCLGGLELFELKIIGKLASERDLSSGLLLLFFKRHASQQDFDQAMEHAQNRAAANAHASRVLRNVPTVRDLLEVFWNPNANLSLRDIKEHMQRHIRMSGKEGQEVVCATLEELTNLIENWGECEIYFRDGVDSKGNTGDIVRRVQLFQKSGHFTASCHGSSGGAALAFSYTTTASGQQILLPEALQEHVQWAVLGGSECQSSSFAVNNPNDASNDQGVLEEFVAAFNLAQRMHYNCNWSWLGIPTIRRLCCASSFLPLPLLVPLRIWRKFCNISWN